MRKVLSILLSVALLIISVDIGCVRVNADQTFNAVVGSSWYQTDVQSSGDAQGAWMYKLIQNQWKNMAGTYSGASGIQGFTFTTTQYGWDGYHLKTNDIKDICGMQAYHVYDVTVKVTHTGANATNIHFSSYGGIGAYEIQKQSTTINSAAGEVTFTGQLASDGVSDLMLLIDLGVTATGASSGCQKGTLTITEATFTDTGVVMDKVFPAIIYDKNSHQGEGDNGWDKTDVEDIGDHDGVWEYKLIDNEWNNMKGSYSGADGLENFKFNYQTYGWDGFHLQTKDLKDICNLENDQIYDVSVTVRYEFTATDKDPVDSNIHCYTEGGLGNYNLSKDLVVFSKDYYEHTFTGQVCPIKENELNLRISMGVNETFQSSGCDKGELVISEFTIQDTGWVPVENDRSSESVGPWGFYALFDAENPTYGHWGKLSYKTIGTGDNYSDTTILIRSRSGWLDAEASWARLKDYASNRLEPGTRTKATIVINSSKATSVIHNDDTGEDNIAYLKVGIGDHSELFTLQEGENILETADFKYNDQYSMDISFELDMLEVGTELNIESIDLLNAVEPTEEEEETKVPVLSPDTMNVDESGATWSDEFNGDELDDSKWQIQTGNKAGVNSPINWGNNEKQNYKEENVSVSGGALNIEAKNEHTTIVDENNNSFDYDYTSGRICTRGKFSAGLGYVEARIKLSTAKGLWPAFWMLGEKKMTWPRNGEIDILEQANANDYFQSTVHFYNSSMSSNDEHFTSKNDSTAHAKMSNIDFSQYHTYGVNRNGDTVAFYLDRQKVYEYTIENDRRIAPSRYPSAMNNDYYLLLNLAVGGNFTGNQLPEDLPKSMQVDYVRYYESYGQNRIQPDIWTNIGTWDLYNGKDDWCDYAAISYDQDEGADLGDTKIILKDSPNDDEQDKEYGLGARLSGYTVGRMNGYRPYKAKITLNSTKAGTLITNVEGEEYRLEINEGDNVIYTDEFFHDETLSYTTTSSHDPTDVYFYLGMVPKNTEIVISEVEFEEQPYEWTPVINDEETEVDPWMLKATFSAEDTRWGAMSYKDISDVNDTGKLGDTLIKVRSASGWDTWDTFAELSNYMRDRTLEHGKQYDLVITYYSSMTNNTNSHHAIVMANDKSFNLPLVECEDLSDTKRVNIGTFTYNAGQSHDVIFKLDMLSKNTCLSIKYIEFVDSNGSGDYDVEPYKQTDTYPKQSGKIFAGWYDDQSFDEVHAKDSGEAYPKFVDEKMLTAKRQWKTDGGAIRFVSSIDVLDYQSVGFAFEGQYGERAIKKQEKEVTKVYKTIKAGNDNITPDNFFADESTYFFTYTIRNMDPSISSTWTVTPYYVTGDGTKVYGKTSEFAK